jgi:hypothetical protein
MKRILIALSLLLCQFSFSLAQPSAKSVLDKCAATVSAKEGISAQFRMESAQYGNASGTIAVKGRKFHATTAAASMWFDGTTQWTYLQKNNEVSVVTPTEAQLQAIRTEAGKDPEGTKDQLNHWVFRGFITYSAQTGLYSKTESYLKQTLPSPSL